MKKVLFATTALVATAGVASADIALSGSAEMGVNGGTDTTTEFFQDLDITFTMSGTADNGLTFGASVDLDESDGDPSGAFESDDDGGTTIFISGDFGTLTMGDTDGALDWALQEVNIGSPGSIDDAETVHAGYNGNAALDGWYDGQVLRYDYSFGDFGIAISVEQDDDVQDFGFGFGVDDNFTPGYENNPDFTADPIWGIGGSYDGMFAGGSFGVGIGYQFTNDGLDFNDPVVPGPGGGGTGLDFRTSDEEASVWGISADVSLDSGFSAAINYSSYSFDLTDAGGPDFDGTHMGIGASYTFDAITVHANYGQYDWDADANALGIPDSSGYGLAAAYDFGGGLSAHLGYGYSDVDGGDDENQWSLGLAMSF